VRTRAWTNGGYRWRTRLRAVLPWFVARWIPKGVDDCGNHHWYVGADGYRACYHCRAVQPGRLTTDPGAVLYSGRAFVRSKRWFDGVLSAWNPRLGGGPMLWIWPGGFEVVAPQGMLLESRDFLMPAAQAVMHRDQVGWGGTALGRRDCIAIQGRDDKGRWVRFAISPEDGIGGAWDALRTAGVAVVGQEQRASSPGAPGG